MFASSLPIAAALLLLLPWASAQAPQCAPDGSPQIRFVAQLSVSGCSLKVHDTGESDGPHLAVEPLMCVTAEGLQNVQTKIDPITQQTYVSVPVTLRDDAMLAEVQRQLRHLSPKSVKFATVSDLSVSTDASSKFQALGFDWSPERAVGIVELGCRPSGESCSICHLASRLRSLELYALDQVIISAGIVLPSTISLFKYRLMVQNRTIFNTDIELERFDCLPKCKQLRFVRLIPLNNCTARVHKRLGMDRDFFIEPLLCHNLTSMSNDSVRYDYSRDMHYLKLDVVLQDAMTVDAVRTQLADLSPTSVTFMSLWRAQSHVASALSHRFEIGPLMMSDDGRSAQLRVYCRTENECARLRSVTLGNSGYLWKHIRYSVMSLAPDQCLVKPEFPRYPWNMQESGKSPILPFVSECNTAPDIVCPDGLRCKLNSEATTASLKTRSPATTPRSPATTPRSPAATPRSPATTASTVGIPIVRRGHRRFLVIQQRMTGSVSFQRTWAEYVRGFGDSMNFWVGLSKIHFLSSEGRTLRVEMTRWNGTEQHVEYAGFWVGDASTSYTMTYRGMLMDRSSVSNDALALHNGMQFSTMDRDNDRMRNSCSIVFGGKGGWWFGRCQSCNPNGVFYSGGAATDFDGYFSWYTGDGSGHLRNIRLMLEL